MVGIELVERVPKGKSGSPSIFTITGNYNLQMMTKLQHHFFTEDHNFWLDSPTLPL